MQAVLYERWPFPLGLIKQQFLVTPGTGGSLKLRLGHACFLHVLLNSEAVPINVI